MYHVALSWSLFALLVVSKAWTVDSSIQEAMDFVSGWVERSETEPEFVGEPLVPMNPEENINYGRPVDIVDGSFYVVQDDGKIGNVQRRIVVGGGAAGLYEAPWQSILLQWNSSKRYWEFRGCGGSLISPKHVLTAAHCVDFREGYLKNGWDAVLVRAYEPFLTNGGLAFHFSIVKSYEIHGNFNDGSNLRDIAIVNMQVPADLATYEVVQLATPNHNIAEGTTLDVYGFGRLSESSTAQVSTIQTVEMPYISNSLCKQFYGYQIKEDMLCAGYINGGQDACGGDSGGPLVQRINGKAVQVGVVSWGDGCARALKPGVYASVPFLYPWIRSYVCNEVTEDDVDMCKPTPMPTPAPLYAPASTTTASSSIQTPSSWTQNRDRDFSGTVPTHTASPWPAGQIEDRDEIGDGGSIPIGASIPISTTTTNNEPCQSGSKSKKHKKCYKGKRKRKV